MSATSDTQNAKVGIEPGAERMFVKSGGEVDIETGGALKVAGTDRTSALSTAPAAVAAGYKVARGVAAITGSGDVVTGLTTVVAVIATMADDASLTNGNAVTATIGDQDGTPAAGSVTLKVWKPTGSGDATPTASGAEVDVNWIAIGT